MAGGVLTDHVSPVMPPFHAVRVGLFPRRPRWNVP
jgi:hypothetical protein